MSPPWSTALAGTLERDQQRLLVAFIEWRARLPQTSRDQFAGGEAERADALAQTEHDYRLLLTQMSELADAVRARIPRGD